MSLYPLLMAPYFLSGAQTPWGGSMLRDAFLKDAPEQTGESLEISALPGCESLVRNGAHAGKPLSRMIELWGEQLTGAQAGMPLVQKLIDAREDTPAQFQPCKASAASGKENAPISTKAWVVLNCEQGARLVYGLNAQGKCAEELLKEGADALNFITVRPGDVYYIPDGMVHAIGGGIQIYAIEQSCEISVRIWNQSGEIENPQGLSGIKAELKLSKLYPTTTLCKGGSRSYYVADRAFELMRLNVSGTMPLEGGRMQLLMPLSPCTLRWGDEEMELSPFDSVLVPAGLENVSVISEDAKLMMATASKRERLREELGYRAQNVAGLMD